MMALNVLYITVLCVWVIESGAVGSLREFLERLTGRRIPHLRPFDCPKCLAFWACAVYVAFWERGRLDGFALCVGASIFADIAGRGADFLIFALKRLIDRLQDRF